MKRKKARNRAIPYTRRVLWSFVLFVLCSVFLAFSGTSAYAARLSVEPPQSHFIVGEEFRFSLYLGDVEEPVNGVSAHLIYDPVKISISRIDNSRSFVSLWVNGPYAQNGDIVGEGISLASETVSSGIVLDVYAIPLTTGDANIEFISGAVLAHDGFGTNVLEEMIPARFSFEERPMTDVPLLDTTFSQEVRIDDVNQEGDFEGVEGEGQTKSILGQGLSYEQLFLFVTVILLLTLALFSVLYKKEERR